MILGEVKKLSDFNPASLHQSLKIHPTSGLEGEGPQGYVQNGSCAWRTQGCCGLLVVLGWIWKFMNYIALWLSCTWLVLFLSYLASWKVNKECLSCKAKTAVCLSSAQGQLTLPGHRKMFIFNAWGWGVHEDVRVCGGQRTSTGVVLRKAVPLCWVMVSHCPRAHQFS